jgi:RsiW-degrading membrane proteinase PrsW (M82 family)
MVGDGEVTPLRWILTSGVTCFLAAALASTSDDVILFFDLVGGLIAPGFIMLFPAYAYLKCVPFPSPFMRVAAYALGIIAIVGTTACTYQAVEEIIGEIKKSA